MKIALALVSLSIAAVTGFIVGGIFVLKMSDANLTDDLDFEIEEFLANNSF